MGDLEQLADSVGARDLVEIGILTVVIYALLRFLSKTRGSGMVRGLSLITIGLILAAQVVIAAFDLAELGKVLDYLLTTVIVGLMVIFQPELRRGLMVLGRYQVLRYFARRDHQTQQADHRSAASGEHRTASDGEDAGTRSAGSSLARNPARHRSCQCVQRVPPPNCL